MTLPTPIELPRTREILLRGVEQGLHLGGQLYLSLGAGSAARSGTAQSGPERHAELMIGDRTEGQPMTPDTLMIWLSSTKPVAAVAIAQLWERGDLDLDDPIARHLPEFAAKGKERITVRHVLTHTSGIRMLSVGWPEASWDEIIATICGGRPEPRWILGEHAGYHLASSWFILGELVRRLDGRHFSDYVRQEIFEPLGMQDSWIGMPREQFLAYDGRLATMYSTENSTPRPRGWRREPHVVGCSPGGNGYGPLRELGRFYEMLLARGSWNGTRILSPQTVEALTTPHRVGLLDKTFKHKLDWGLGFIVNSNHYGAGLPPYGYGRHASRRTFGHSGFQSSTGFADPESRLVVALAVNGNPGEPRHTERFRDITEAIYQDLGLAQATDG